MAMLSWEPFREMQDALRRFSPLYLPDNGARDDASTRSWVPLANISESDKEYLIRCELPDVKKEDVKIAVADGVITISGERKLEREDQSENAIRIASVYGAFPRSFVLPDYADANGIHAEVEDAACALTYPKPRLRNPN